MADKNGTTIILLAATSTRSLPPSPWHSAPPRRAGMATTMFFTFWGLKAIQKGNLTGKGFMGRMLGC